MIKGSFAWWIRGIKDTITKPEIEETETECPYGYENCSEDDFETMCDECLNDRGQAWDELRSDTYD